MSKKTEGSVYAAGPHSCPMQNICFCHLKNGLGTQSVVAVTCINWIAKYEKNLLNGFWSPGKYYGFLNTFKYHEEKVALDKYTIVEAESTRIVYNWLQYFALEDLEREFVEAGFSIEGIYSDVSGTPYDQNSNEFAVIAKKA